MSASDWGNFDDAPDRPRDDAKRAASSGEALHDAVPHEIDLARCPFCRRAVRPDADVCHHCRNFILRDDEPRRVPGRWLVLGLLLSITILMLIEYRLLSR
jgi:predicted nucleic acid-binding Zn ribbon protein